MSHRHANPAILAALCMSISATGVAKAEAPFAEVGKQVPITVLINASPWYKGFEKAVELYEDQTGNVVNLEVTPFDGMLEKARSAVRNGGTSPLDLVNMNGLSAVEFYEGGFLTPFTDIDPDFKWPKEAYTYGDSNCWDAGKRYPDCSTGKVMGFSPNGNVQLYYYRSDVFKEKGLKPPATFDEVLADCKLLHNPPAAYGYLQRGEKGNGIFYDWMAYMLSYGAKAEADPAHGDYTVTINSPQAKLALDKFIEISRNCGPANYASLGQGDVIQLMQTGKGMQGHAVVAAFPNFDDPRKSAVTGQIDAAVLPKANAEAEPGIAIGNLILGVPANASEAGRKGAVAFAKWFLTYEAQYAYAEAGGIPVRSDVLSSDLRNRPEFRWMPAYQDSLKYGRQVFFYAEGTTISNNVGLRINQALVGEMSSAAALNQIARDMKALFEKNGRKTGMLPPLPE
ncbi:ABC transporter substrate-binding protein [Labrys neptuniae]